MKIPVTIMVDTEDRTREEMADRVGEVRQELVRNEHRAWALYEMGESSGHNYCDAPDGFAGYLADTWLKAIQNALEEAAE